MLMTLFHVVSFGTQIKLWRVRASAYNAVSSIWPSWAPQLAAPSCVRDTKGQLGLVAWGLGPGWVGKVSVGGIWDPPPLL
jgi:hypothetical protein